MTTGIHTPTRPIVEDWPVRLTPLATVIADAWALIADRDAWCQGSARRGAQRCAVQAVRDVDHTSPAGPSPAVQMLSRAADSLYNIVGRTSARVLQSLGPDLLDIAVVTTVNDRRDRASVERMYALAFAMAMDEGNGGAI